MLKFAPRNALFLLILWLLTGLLQTARSPLGEHLQPGESLEAYLLFQSAPYLLFFSWLSALITEFLKTRPVSRIRSAGFFVESAGFTLLLGYSFEPFTQSVFIFILLVLFVGNRCERHAETYTGMPVFGNSLFPLLVIGCGMLLFIAFYGPIYNPSRVDRVLVAPERIHFIYGIALALFSFAGITLFLLAGLLAAVRKYTSIRIDSIPFFALLSGLFLAGTVVETLGAELDLAHLYYHMTSICIPFFGIGLVLSRYRGRVSEIFRFETRRSKQLGWLTFLALAAVSIAIHNGFLFNPWYHIFSLLKGFLFLILVISMAALAVRLLPELPKVGNVFAALCLIGAFAASGAALTEVQKKPALKWALVQYEEFPRVYLSFIRFLVPAPPLRSRLGLGTPLRHKPEFAFALNPEIVREGDRKFPEKPFNLILINIDALRWDVMEMNDSSGYEPRELREWINSEAIDFTRVYAPSNSSFRSVALLFGAEGNRHVLYPGSGLENTLTQWLRAEKIAPWIVVEGTGVTGFFRKSDPVQFIGQPVDHATGRNQPAGDQINRFLETLKSDSSGAPFFAYLHLMDVHNDLYEKDGVFLHNSEPFSLYRHNLRYISREFSRMIDSLKHRGLYDNTMIVLTSDHGEEFKEHESTLHGHHFFEQDMRIPLIWRIPGVNATKIGGITSNADWIPTLLELSGYRWKNPIYPEAYVKSHAPAISEPHFSDPDSLERTLYFQSNMTDKIGLLENGRWKYEYWPTYDVEALFDLQSDPEEYHNAAGKFPAKADSLRKILFLKSAEMNGHSFSRFNR